MDARPASRAVDVGEVRFWQAVVTAQLAAGSVAADNIAHGFPAHLLVEMLNIAIGGVIWFAGRKLDKVTK